MLLSLMTISVAGVVVPEVTTVSTEERSVSQMNIDSMLIVEPTCYSYLNLFSTHRTSGLWRSVAC